MELRHLRYFVAVAEEMNIHRAAARLHISQPPLSLSIKQLEDEIGAILFSREGRGIKITPAGELYLVHARKILEQTAQAAEQARQSHLGLAGTLRIGFISSSITGILQKSVAIYKYKYPNVVIKMCQLNNSEVARQLLSNDIDVGILRLPETCDSSLQIIEKHRESWCAAMPDTHPLAAKKEISIKDLANKRLIFYPRWNTNAGYDDVMRQFQEHGIEPLIFQEATEQMTIAGLVASGMGLGIVPECMSIIKIPGITHRTIKQMKNKTGLAFICKKNADILARNFCDIDFKKVVRDERIELPTHSV